MPACLFILLLFLTACHKDKESAKEEDLSESCKPVVPAGRLSHDPGTDTYNFRSTGGGRIKIALGADLSLRAVTINHDDYPGFKIELWGIADDDKLSANHENLNGKHIKDRIGTRRSIIFPDGTKITMVAEGLYERLLSISIYDGDESHRINGVCNTLEHSSTSRSMALKLDSEEADGETGGFELTETGLTFFNQYTEEMPGTHLMNYEVLGTLEINNPTQVNDYYDDPRLGHT